MTRCTSLLWLVRSSSLALLALLASTAERVTAQTPELPRLEYYVARDLFDSGHTREATEGFRAAMNRGHQVKGQRWIDAIPPLVMLGECYYQQGAIAQALQQYDAALMVCLAFPDWADAMRSSETLPELPVDSKVVLWTKLSTSNSLVRVPSIVQVAVDPSQARFNPDGALIPGGSAIMRVDVPEVMRCLAVALHRRSHLLGPLTSHSPLTQPIVLHFARTPGNKSAWLQSAWQALHGLALLANQDDTQAVAKLSAGAAINSRTDYFMTAPCLIALATLDCRSNKESAALTRLGDASLRAAQLEQSDLLAESLSMIGQLSCASRRVDLLPVLQAAAQWCRKGSVLPFMAASAAVSELAVIASNPAAHEAAAAQMLVLLRGKDQGADAVELPRLQAQLGFAMARAAAMQNQLPAAESQLETSMSMLRGNAKTGAAVPRVFQTQLTIELASRKELPEAAAESIFDVLLREPSTEQWRRHPLECLVSISTAHLPAYEKALEFAVRRGDASLAVARMSRHQQERYHEVLPLGGRLLAARQWMAAEKSEWPSEFASSIDGLLKASPAVRSLPIAMRETLDGLGREPLVVEDRTISADAKKKFAELAKQSEAAEVALMNLALQRLPIPRGLPGAVELTDVQSALSGDDLVLSFVHTSTNVYGAAISKASHHVWSVAESPVFDSKIALLLTQIGLASAPNLDVGTKVSWRNTAAELSKQLLPDAARQMVASAGRVIIVPSGNLWYLPFDLLPIDADGKAPLLARHAVCYVPMLGYVKSLNRAAPTVRNTVGLYNNFFTADRVSNQALSAQIGQDLGQVSRLDCQAKSGLTTPSWLRLRADQIWVAAELPMQATPWEIRVLPIEPSKENALANWMQSPLRTPSRLFLPGLQSAASKVEMKGGQELFIPACTFMATGVRSVWMSRWKVGGRSTHTALGRLLEEMQYEPPSSAWQRTAIALWAEKLPTAEEPILPAVKGLPSSIDGEHPLLWSGYMMLGDHRAPD